MKNFVLAIVLICTINQAYALELVHAKILDHAEWTTGGAEGSFIEDSTEIVVSPVHGCTTTTVMVTPITAKAPSNINIYGQHRFTITNHTDTDQIYKYQFQICVDSTHCFNYVNHIQISPHGYASDSGTSRVAGYFDKPGKYQSMAVTAVDGESSNSARTTSPIVIK